MYSSLQFDISIKNQGIINSTGNIMVNLGVCYCGGLQLATDGKIYVSYFGSNYLHSINDPNKYGISCNFQLNSVYLSGKNCRNGLPTFMQSYFYVPDFNAGPLCYGDSTKFKISNNKMFDSVFWNFGNAASGPANVSRLSSPKHLFTDTGAYHVRLIGYHGGVPDTSLRIMWVTYNPSSLFTVTDSSKCLMGNHFEFNNLSSITNGSMRFEWDFGDGVHAFDSLLTKHTYFSADTFNVKLFSISGYGCADTFSSQVIVKPSPTALFSINENFQCFRNNEFIFNNHSSIYQNNSINYKWYFGNGDSSILKNPVYSYSIVDSYSVTLIATSTLGCKDAFENYVLLYPSPKAYFSVNDSIQCLKNNIFIFNDLSAYPGNDSLTYRWYFDDSLASSSTNYKFKIKSVDTFRVKEKVSSFNECTDSFFKKIIVLPSPDRVLAVNNPIQCLNNNLFKFSTTQNFLSKYLWDFSDGSTDTVASPVHSFKVAGNYNAILIIENNFICDDTLSLAININPSPNAVFSLIDSIQCLNGNLFGFINSQSSVVSCKWNFGDGYVDTTHTVFHSFANPGIFQIKLTTENQFGCKDSNLKTIIVNPSPNADFLTNDSVQCLKGNSFGFICGQLSLINRGWEFGDGTVDTGLSVIHIYTSAGNYTVKLVVENQYGCKDSTQENAVIYPSPDASFTVNNTGQCLKENLFRFVNGQSSIISRLWEFGDGNTDTTKICIFKYLIPDTFSVKLRLVNNYGCIDSFIKDVVVFPSPDAAFMVNDTDQCLNGNLFSYSCQNSIYGYLWAFGDGVVGSNKIETHSYINAGIYAVKLIVKTKDNCNDTSVQNVTVRISPKTPIVSNNSPLCENENLFLHADCPGLVNYWWWSDNDFNSGLQNPEFPNVHIMDAGNYYVKTIFNGCESYVATTHVIINPIPVFSLGSDKTICHDEMIILDPGNFHSYIWQDGSATRILNVTDPGIYSVAVTNSSNCKYSDTIIVTKKCPTVLFIPNVFSPNHDGINDLFIIITDNIKEFDINIFDIWGLKVFHSNDPTIGWDGTYKGSECPAGVYYYQVYTLDTSKKIKNVNGSVTLLR